MEVPTSGLTGPHDPLTEPMLFPSNCIRELHLQYHSWRGSTLAVLHPSYYPSLQTLAIIRSTNVPHVLSSLLSDPANSPSLKTLAFLDCVITKRFLVALKRFASSRQNATSTCLHRVVQTCRRSRGETGFKHGFG